MTKKYKLFGFYQVNFDNEKENESVIPINFKINFNSIFGITKHIESMNLIKGTYTFIIEVDE